MTKRRYRVTITKLPRGSGFRPLEGWVVRVNRRDVASIAPLHIGWGHETDGWYFVARDDELGIPLRNTCGERGRSEEDVKAAAVAYVNRCLSESGKGVV